MPDLPNAQYNPNPHQNGPVYPRYPGDSFAVEDVQRMRVDALRNLYAGGPTQQAYQPITVHRVPESPHWVSRAPWRPYMFAILSPLFLPILFVYTLVRGVRAWGQFMGEICEGLL